MPYCDLVDPLISHGADVAAMMLTCLLMLATARGFDM